MFICLPCNHITWSQYLFGKFVDIYYQSPKSIQDLCGEFVLLCFVSVPSKVHGNFVPFNFYSWRFVFVSWSTVISYILRNPTQSEYQFTVSVSDLSHMLLAWQDPIKWCVYVSVFDVPSGPPQIILSHLTYTTQTTYDAKINGKTNSVVWTRKKSPKKQIGGGGG